MDSEGNVESVVSIPASVNKSNNQSYENPILQRYSKLPDGPPPPNRLAPINPDTARVKNTLPPIPSQSLDREKFPRYMQRQEFMPKISTPTGSYAGSVADSSIRSDMSRTRYEAESPDELALVRAASTYNCCLKGRSAKSVTVWLPGAYTNSVWCVL